MMHPDDLNVVNKIENLFAHDIGFFSAQKDLPKKSLFSKFKTKNINSVFSFLLKKLYRLIPNFFKDILFFGWVSHNTPATKLFARTKYDEFRIKLDSKVSALSIKAFSPELSERLQSTFQAGFFTFNITNLSSFDNLINDVLDYAQSHHAGARPYYKDGENKKIAGSFSAYYAFSDEDSEKISILLNNNLENDFNKYLSVIAGYKCELRDISYSLGIVFGENSNSEMHQDTFSAIAKGFIYLQDIDEKDAPFEYLEGSYHDASFRSSQTNQAVLCGDYQNSDSTRIRGSILEDAIRNYNLQTFTGSKGLFILANTAGYHRKGAHKSHKPRITLNFEIPRKGIVGKLIRNIFAIMKSRTSRILTFYR